VSWLHPASSRDLAERRHQIVEHRGIGIFLDRQRGRGVTDEQRHRTFPRGHFPDEFRNLSGEIDKAGPGCLDGQQRRHEGVGGNR
jgi:hypothetical protein